MEIGSFESPRLEKPKRHGQDVRTLFIQATSPGSLPQRLQGTDEPGTVSYFDDQNIPLWLPGFHDSSFIPSGSKITLAAK